MATKKIEMQDSNGNVYYPHTDASVVKNGSKTVADQLNDLGNESYKKISNIINKIYNATTNNKINIRLIGDSIVAGYRGTGYIGNGTIIWGDHQQNTAGHCWANSFKEYMESNFNCNVTNWGASGSTSTDLVNNISTMIQDSDDIIICMVGANNRNLDNGLNILEADLKTIYNYSKNKNKDIIFISETPVEQEYYENVYGITMDKIDNIFDKVCAELKIEYISMYKVFDKFLLDNGINIQDIFADVSHPNDIGYDVMFYLITNSLGIGTKYSVRNIIEKINDSGWIDLPLIGNAVAYSSGTPPQYRRKNGFVEIDGIIKGVTNFNTSTDIDFALLPEGFKSPKDFHVICQGSAKNSWLLRVSSDGKLKGSRYGTADYASSMAGNEWLTFHVMYSL